MGKENGRNIYNDVLQNWGACKSFPSPSHIQNMLLFTTNTNLLTWSIFPEHIIILMALQLIYHVLSTRHFFHNLPNLGLAHCNCPTMKDYIQGYTWLLFVFCYYFIYNLYLLYYYFCYFVISIKLIKQWALEAYNFSRNIMLEERVAEAWCQPK